MTSTEVNVTGRIGDQQARWRRFVFRRESQVLLDVVALLVALLLAYSIRFDFGPPFGRTWGYFFSHDFPVVGPKVIGLQVLMFYAWGIYKFVWRYVGLNEIRAFNGAFTSAALVLVAFRLGLPDSFRLFRVPLSVIAIYAVLGFGFTLGLRVTRRVFYERSEMRHRISPRAGGKGGDVSRSKPVLLVGAGKAGVLAARELVTRRRDVAVEVVGFVDDDTTKLGAVIQGITVLGTTGDLPDLTKRFKIDHVIITIAKAEKGEIRRIVEICERIPVRTRIIPGLFDILDGRVSVSAIRDVEIEDLLGRESVRLDDHELLGFLGGKTVMVTGAGGSIGSEIVRQLVRFEPERILLVERTEFALYEIHEELTRAHPDLSIVPLIADVCDAARIEEVFARYSPRVVFHAAAHKHVPMMEVNVGEAVKNNVFGTEVVGMAAGRSGVETFVLISTDKAVNPTSVMGCSKRAAELVVQELNHRQFDTAYVAVRFGNVLGSTGSVIPKFREQIARGGPVTVTDPRMTRYFMTIPEATQLVLQAAALGEGGEIFVLDMGEPVRIVDLARDMIALSGFEPEVDIDIVFTGVRPGEKLFEELGTAEDRVDRTRHEKIFVGRIPERPPSVVRQGLMRLRSAVEARDDRLIREALQSVVPEADLLEDGRRAAPRVEPRRSQTTGEGLQPVAVRELT
jgi:FlaA1/EpsC-like NDP-sugar epimerase